MSIACPVFHHSRYGNGIFAMGGDPESAGACGVPIERLATDLYVASGAAAA
ncbi:MAG: ABC transporter permease, partial [Caenispirillum sp.]|nr:ABC transporter permease [Caenispirillum sp.]